MVSEIKVHFAGLEVHFAGVKEGKAVRRANDRALF
jgi:hypothetical protein